MIHIIQTIGAANGRLAAPAKRCLKALLVLGLLFAAAELAHAQSDPAKAGSQPTVRIHGSPAISDRLMRDLASAFLRSGAGSSEDQNIRIGVSTTAEGDFVLGAKDQSTGALPTIRIRGNGANQALDDLSTGDADIVVAYRPVTDSEHAAFKANASVDMRSRSAEYVIGLDGIEILANKANKLPTISRETLRGIYSKKLNNWGEAGLVNAKLDGPIRAIGPGAGSNATELLRTLVMEGKPPLYQNSLDWGGGLPKLVSADPNSIGFVGMRLRGDNRSLDIEECGVTYPFDPFAIKAQDHPLAVPLYLYVNSATKNPARDAFLKFVMSKAGQDIVGRDFVNLEVVLGDDDSTARRVQTVSQQKPTLSDRHDLFRNGIGNARRLSTTFRFRFDSAKLELDSRGERDLEELVQTVRDSDIAAGRLVLFGFADALGPEGYNVKLAGRRAGSVAAKLRSLGLKIADDQVVAIGEDVPVGCNTLPNGDDDERGRARNRRVEVWVRNQAQ
ncbi:MAG: substrate-binding domain-containing protein [Hyphomicrobiales bacterium]